MKKLLMAATIVSAVVAVHANAASYTISSNITDTGLVLTTVDPGVYQPNIPGVANTLAFSGEVDVTVTGGSYTINGGNMALNGVTSLDLGFVGVTLDFVNAAGTVANNGVIINSGILNIDASDGTPVPPLDFSELNLNMSNTGFHDDGLGGNLGGYTGLPLGSGVVNPDGSITIALLGLPGTPAGAALADAAAGLAVFGFPAAIFLGGTITLTPTEIPLPAAAWLFGSALMGLAGVARKRKLKA